MDNTNLDTNSLDQDINEFPEITGAINQDDKNKDQAIDHSFIDNEDVNSYCDDIQTIIKHLDRLDDILNPIKFNPGWMNLNTELNNKIEAINDILDKLQKLYSNEYKSIAVRADILKEKIKQALITSKAEQQNPDGDVIYTGVFIWLEKTGPELMNNIIALKNKVP